MGFNCTYIQTNKQTHIHKDLSRFIFSAGLMVTVREEEDEEKDEDEDEDEDEEEEIKRDGQ